MTILSRPHRLANSRSEPPRPWKCHVRCMHYIQGHRWVKKSLDVYPSRRSRLNEDFQLSHSQEKDAIEVNTDRASLFSWFNLHGDTLKHSRMPMITTLHSRSTWTGKNLTQRFTSWLLEKAQHRSDLEKTSMLEATFLHNFYLFWRFLGSVPISRNSKKHTEAYKDGFGHDERSLSHEALEVNTECP
jgi:hypothetical protein